MDALSTQNELTLTFSSYTCLQSIACHRATCPFRCILKLHCEKGNRSRHWRCVQRHSVGLSMRRLHAAPLQSHKRDAGVAGVGSLSPSWLTSCRRCQPSSRIVQTRSPGAWHGRVWHSPRPLRQVLCQVHTSGTSRGARYTCYSHPPLARLSRRAGSRSGTLYVSRFEHDGYERAGGQPHAFRGMLRYFRIRWQRSGHGRAR